MEVMDLTEGSFIRAGKKVNLWDGQRVIREAHQVETAENAQDGRAEARMLELLASEPTPLTLRSGCHLPNRTKV